MVNIKLAAPGVNVPADDVDKQLPAAAAEFDRAARFAAVIDGIVSTWAAETLPVLLPV